MASFVRYEPSYSGTGELMTSPAMATCIRGFAEKIRHAAEFVGGDSLSHGQYGITGPYGKKRVHFNVYTQDWHAKYANSRYDSLAKAIGRRY